MNNSQLLHKISDLKYNIRIKEAEYARALNIGDQLYIDSNKASLTLMKEELAISVYEFDAIPAPSVNERIEDSKKIGWWQKSPFNLRAFFNGKH